MKIYLFNSHNGLFEGEAFENITELQYEEGVTTIPPPGHEQGQVPVFDCHKQEWAVIPITIARQLLNSSEPMEE